MLRSVEDKTSVLNVSVLCQGGGGHEKALRRLELKVELSESLYPPVQFVSLRKQESHKS